MGRLLRYKLYETILLLGKDRFASVDIRIKVKGGGHVAQVYAIRQSIAKALVAYYQEPVDVGPATLRGQEVRWSRSPCPLPEVLQMNARLLCICLGPESVSLAVTNKKSQM